MNGINTADAALQTLRGDVINIVLGTVFLAVGATGCAIAAIRRRRGIGILVWWGISSGMFGLQTLGDAHHLDRSATFAQLCRAVRKYRGHVPAVDCAPIRLARADSR